MKLRLDDIFTSGMVLQHGTQINIFGKGNNDELVTVCIQEKKASAIVKNNRWIVELSDLKISEDERLVVSTQSELIELNNILIGDVYFLTGQSNMEFRFEDCETVKEDKKNSQNKYIRYYEVPRIEYEDDTVKIPDLHSEGWQVCNEETVLKFSAIGYYVADFLQHDTNIPIGLVSVNKGGTSASCWMSEYYLKQHKEIKETYYDDYYDSIMNQTDEQEELEIVKYRKQLQEYMQKVELYKSKYPKKTTNQLKKDVGHTPWPGPKGKKDFCRPAGLYHTMFEKVCMFSAKAVIWYQGEEDTKRAHLYYQLLNLLIDNWRKDMMSDIPFIIVQLPEYRDDKTDDWPIVREAQRQVCEDKDNCFLVVAMNCGEEFNIHPANKKTLAKRIYMRMKEVFYDEDFDGHSPYIKEVKIDSNTIIEFDQELISEEKQEFTLESKGKQIPIVGEIMENKIIFNHNLDGMFSYGFTNYCKIGICGKNGLPISPFRIHLLNI